jgi:hypothetical protein
LVTQIFWRRARLIVLQVRVSKRVDRDTNIGHSELSGSLLVVDLELLDVGSIDLYDLFSCGCLSCSTSILLDYMRKSTR